MISSQIFLTIRATECDDSASSNRYTAQKMMFSIKDFFNNMTKSVRNCGFVHIYWRNP